VASDFTDDDGTVSDDDMSTDDESTAAPPAWFKRLQCAEGCSNEQLALVYGEAGSQGRRPSMEDATDCAVSAMGGQYAFFGVYDGHNGAGTAHYLESALRPAVFRAEPSEVGLRASLLSAFKDVDAHILDGSTL